MLERLPLRQPVVCEAHRILLAGVRGHGKASGEYRHMRRDRPCLPTLATGSWIPPWWRPQRIARKRWKGRAQRESCVGLSTGARGASARSGASDARCLFHKSTASSPGCFLGTPRSSVASGAGLEPGASRGGHGAGLAKWISSIGALYKEVVIMA
jgi:hypothetical protein